MISKRAVGAIAGSVLAVAVVAGQAFAAAAPTLPAPAPAQAASIRCADEWLAAASNPSTATWRAVGDCEVDRRLQTIATLRTGIAGAKALTGDHRSALTAILDRSESGLEGLRSKIDGDASLADLRPDIHAIFQDYRIYALVVRQVALVRGDDAVDAAVARLTEAASKLEAAIATAQANGKDVTSANQHLAAMKAALADASAQVKGDAAAVLPLLPAGWNAGTAKPVLDAARTSLLTARTDLRTAIAEGRAAMAALR